ncbi:MAG: FdhF/YdeP family oxidoreductase [Verrucomicrobia bacterium]|nr:FdhF/YdeP family oxidoreductase [Verrucomicrobiota bacterium]
MHPEGAIPGAQPPIDIAGIKLRERHGSAAGLAAIVATMRYVWGGMGIARGTQALLQVNQLDGFDCQSCAWPSPDQSRHVAEFCENGAKAVSNEGTRKRVTPEFFKEHSLHDLLGRSDYWLNEQGRLTHPVVLTEKSNHYEPISWEQAFTLLAAELNSLDSPHEAAFYTSGRTSNEAAYLYQLFARIFGTNNLPDCSNMCHESSGAALKETIGIGKGTVTLDDFLKADAIFVIGQNPGTNHPRMLTSLELAKENGAKIISVNPLPEVGNFRFKNANPQSFKDPLKTAGRFFGKGAKLSDLWLQVKINGDLALFKGIMKELLEEERKSPGKIFDHEFIARYTTGSKDLLAELEIASWQAILDSSGLTRGQIREASDIVLGSRNIICCWAMGLTQHKNSVATIREVVNFLLLRGNIGRPGAGVCPVRGHSNVQGDRTMGIWERPTPLFLEKLAQRYGFEPPQEHGCDTVDCIQAMHRGQIKLFFALGGNFLSAAPDTELTAEALGRCRLTAHVSTKLNRSHLVTGRQALILPCLGRSEIDQRATGNQFVTVEDSMGIINPSRGQLAPASDCLLSEPAIVARLAEAVLGNRSRLRWGQWAEDYNLIREEIAQVIPGFEQFNARITGGIFYLPNPPRDERKFPTRTGKATFTLNGIEPLPVEIGQYVLMTIRSHDQFNTTIYGLDDRYRGIYNGRRVIFMNPEDVEEAGLTQGQPVDITSHFDGYERQANRFLVAPYPIPRHCVAAYFPEANVLIPVASVAERSNTPTSKSVIVTISPSPDVESVSRRLRVEAAEAIHAPVAQALSEGT